MSQQQEETKKQEEATQDKQSLTSTKATTSSLPSSQQPQPQQPEPAPAPQPEQEQPQPQPDNNNDNEELIIDQVRNELETYFAPQNIQNDFNLRQKMTTDGYIDIDLLLDLKLISDLVGNREILIEAISRSKLLVMNTGCTMVKYMPLLERNVLILRDIATSTKKEEILSIFNNANCSEPSQVHSDIGNNWFCQFKTEEECLSTAKYLQQFGSFNDEKLHVRVKAIHDKNKADQSPQMQPSPPPPPPPPQQIPYAQGYYGPTPQYAYYGSQGPPPPPPPMVDPYYKASQSPVRGSSRNKRERVRDDDVEDSGVKEEDRTAISDYPGVFDKYTQQEFLDIYKQMKQMELDIPQSMRGRDGRIVSEETLKPDVLLAKKEEKSGVKGKGKKGKRRGKNKKEMQGTYYEEEVYDYNDENYYEEYYEDDAYYNNYNYTDTYYKPQRQRRQRPQSQRQQTQRQTQGYGYRKRGGNRGGNPGGRRGGNYGNYGGRKYEERGKRNNYYEKGDGNYGYSAENYGAKASAPTYASNFAGKYWSPRPAKQYATNKGVYRTKTVSSAY